jgi:hypothetical protein
MQPDALSDLLPPFSPTRVALTLSIHQKIGADGYSKNAAEAVKLVNSLMERQRYECALPKIALAQKVQADAVGNCVKPTFTPSSTMFDPIFTKLTECDYIK